MENEYGFELKNSTVNNIRTRRSADDYASMTEHQRIFYKVEMYAGSREQIPREDYIFDFKTLKYQKVEVSIPEALERMYLEILTNASDNVDNSRRFGVSPGSIHVTINDEWITIRSEGEPIPIVPRKEISTPDKILVTTDFIFGTIGSSSNYDTSVTRTSVGVNGIGSKLTNIFSSRFRVTVGDNKNGVHQVSEWSHNMHRHVQSTTTPPYVQNGEDFVLSGLKYNGPNFVEVSWKFDLRPFGYTLLTTEMKELFCRHLIDISFTCKVVTFFNNQKYDYRRHTDYMTLFYPKEIKHFCHYEWILDPVEEGKKLEDLVVAGENPKYQPVLEIIIIDTPNEGMLLSFVNGMITRNNGIHVDVILEVLNTSIKSFFKDDENKEKLSFDIRDIKKHLTCIVNARVQNPQFNSQSKSCLKSPKIKVKIPDNLIRKIKTWSLIDHLRDIVDLKLLKSYAKKTDGKKTKHVHIQGAEDANWAGTDRSLDCTLMIGEGNSAGAYISKYILGTPCKKDAFGKIDIRGKLLNVTDAPLEQIFQNEEITDIKMMLGLREEENYSLSSATATLRYGYVCICSDADTDGSHICSLLLNFFYRRYPTFLSTGRICFLLTPVIRVLKGKSTHRRFYSLEEFESWRSSPDTPIRGFEKPKYYKGLATARDSDIIEDIQHSSKIICVFDSAASTSLDIAFKGDMTHERKKWISEWRNRLGFQDVLVASTNELYKYINITDYINTKLVEYSVDTFSRSLPSFRDGLKKSQRQILWYVLAHWDYGKKEKDSVKASRIASNAGEFSKYHHGDTALCDTLIKMVQDYPGSNNLNYFRKEGQFGSRQGNRYGIGKDCGAGRYVETMPEWWLKYVFKKELIAMVPKVIVEDEEAEPQWIPCDIPVHVINGTLGLSTAYSVYIPNYHPLDVINWIFAYLHESEKPTLIPWFRGFTGNVEVVVKKKATPKDSTFLEEDEDPIVQGLTLKTEGHFTILQERIKNFREEKNGEILTIEDKVYDLKITEIPIGISIFKYRKWLEDLIVEKKIEDIDDKMTSSDTPNIIVRGWRKEPTAKTLKLIKCAGISNISLINDQAIPLSYTSIDNVLEDYCSSMKELYYQFHEVSCKKLEKEIEDLQNLVKLITLIVQEIIIITKVSLSTIHTSLEKHQIPLQIYEKLNITSLSEEGIQRHTKKYESVIEEHRLLQQQSPIKIWEDSLLRFQKALLKREEFAKLEI